MRLVFSSLGAVVAVSVLAPVSLLAQASPSAAPGRWTETVPSVSGVGRAEVKLVPDRARIRVAVQTQGVKAAAAAVDNSARTAAVMAALRRLGIANEQLSTASYTVSPRYRYSQGQAPTIVGYEVTNSVVAELRDLTRVGRVLDTALGNGANLVSSLEFFASNTDSARRSGVALAVGRARAEAAAAAEAAGGRLGPLVALTIGGGAIPPPVVPLGRMAAMAAEAAPPTPINPGETAVGVTVAATWRFVPAQ